MTRWRRVLLVLLPCVLLACGARRVPGDGDGGSADARRADARPDARRGDIIPPPEASAPDLFPAGCYCKPGEAYRLGACVPTLELGCGPSCDPKVAKPCAKPDQECDQWAGAACCACAMALPACVPGPTIGPITGPLRSSPNTGIAGQKVKIKVEGARFYIGALFYNMRLGSEVRMQGGGSKCSFAAEFEPPKPGVYPVEVSQYGGNEPWVLAGFYTATAGGGVPPSIQPGYPCKQISAPGDQRCVSGAPYKCACSSGRCRCQK